MDFFFRAPDGDMKRWKKDARERKVTFSQHIRDALQAFGTVEAEPLAERLGPDGGGSASTSPASQTPARLVELAEQQMRDRGREVKPDPRVK